MRLDLSNNTINTITATIQNEIVDQTEVVKSPLTEAWLKAWAKDHITDLKKALNDINRQR